MYTIDPYTPERHHYECRHCLSRTITDETRYVCADCGGALQNIAVPRE